MCAVTETDITKCVQCLDAGLDLSIYQQPDISFGQFKRSLKTFMFG